MKRFVEGTGRGQSTLLPECLEDWVDENNPVRVIGVFVDELNLGELGFEGIAPEATGRPGFRQLARGLRLKVAVAGCRSSTGGAHSGGPYFILCFFIENLCQIRSQTR